MKHLNIYKILCYSMKKKKCLNVLNGMLKHYIQILMTFTNEYNLLTVYQDR